MSKLKVKVNSAEANGANVDEVFITSDTSEGSTDSYVNRVVYAKPGLFKDGEMSTESVAELEKQSKEILEQERRDTLAREAKEAEAAQKLEAQKVAAKAPKKKEG